MYAKIRLFIGVMVVSMAASAYAHTLAGGAIYGGGTQVAGVCYLHNAGGSTVSVTTNLIFRQGSTVPLANTFDDCSSLPPGGTCGISANIVNNLPHSCKMVVSPSGADVRGSFEVRDGQGNVLNNIELR
jgi:hypothetical protein